MVARTHSEAPTLRVVLYVGGRVESEGAIDARDAWDLALMMLGRYVELHAGDKLEVLHL
jgi:hypothetical protein